MSKSKGGVSRGAGGQSTSRASDNVVSALSHREIKDGWGSHHNFMRSHGLKTYDHEDYEEARELSRAYKSSQQYEEDCNNSPASCASSYCSSNDDDVQNTKYAKYDSDDVHEMNIFVCDDSVSEAFVGSAANDQQIYDAALSGDSESECSVDDQSNKSGSEIENNADESDGEVGQVSDLTPPLS